ncbi:uncharacterized protein LOC110712093 [Chenopodium quinoa]|uniref:uncharacterized protein LOC110712093 n=1 Tax=Chenopodium quinoa TaxID=63459 RepID=UPI000B7957AA|nr:uncharacterized protein LOC110712093 [Chenopodium quinoa]
MDMCVHAWQLCGIPCKHAMRETLHSKLDPHNFVSEWYSVNRYKLTYENNIKLIPDLDQWPEMGLLDRPEINPPGMRRGVGRPARNKRRDQDEQVKGKRSKTVACSNCQCYGHNSQTCQGGLTRK